MLTLRAVLSFYSILLLTHSAFAESASVSVKGVKDSTSFALQMLVDKSRSMTKEDRLVHTKSAIKNFSKTFSEEDFIGVMGFDDNPFVVVRLARFKEKRDEFERRVQMLFPNFGTSLVAPLDEGKLSLSKIKASRKLVIVITDQMMTDAPIELYVKKLKQMKAAGITTTFIVFETGEKVDELKPFSEAGGGRFYKVKSSEEIEKALMEERKLAKDFTTVK